MAGTYASWFQRAIDNSLANVRGNGGAVPAPHAHANRTPNRAAETDHDTAAELPPRLPPGDGLPVAHGDAGPAIAVVCDTGQRASVHSQGGSGGDADGIDGDAGRDANVRDGQSAVLPE